MSQQEGLKTPTLVNDAASLKKRKEKKRKSCCEKALKKGGKKLIHRVLRKNVPLSACPVGFAL